MLRAHKSNKDAVYEQQKGCKRNGEEEVVGAVVVAIYRL